MEAPAPRFEILLADDERIIRNSLRAMLEANGYSVRSAADGREVVELHRKKRPDLILLDVMMPVLDGYAACREIRKTDSSTPVIFLTALDSDIDELRGLHSGADSFTPKTVSQDVLLARIAAAIRRHRREEPRGDFIFAGRRVKPESCAMYGSDGTEVTLTEREIALLRFFAMHPGEVCSRDFLCTKLWGRDFNGTDNALTVAIGRLREKLGADGGVIEALRGIGYLYRS